ncbi:MAG: polyhydroxyalkanoate depolymerase [Alphaproteobacteria bacterium]|nr:polyhydroxyalkanoate depolymerase [Alphaproteobacteria bacterium]
MIARELLADALARAQRRGLLAAGVADLWTHAGRAHRRPAWHVRPGGTAAPEIAPETLLDLSFCTLRRFALPGSASAPAVLVAVPLSGHFAQLFEDLVAALAPDHEVFVTDWKDAAEVPLDLGPFRLDDQIAYLVGFLRRIGRRAHVVAASQSGVPALAAAAAMAAADDARRPASVTLMGAMIDARVNATPVERMASALFPPQAPTPAAGAALLALVSPLRPGAGRLVYPAWAQLAGLSLYLLRRLSIDAPTPLDVFQSALLNDGAAAQANRDFFHLFLTLMDLPGELYRETMRALFAESALASGTLAWRGATVSPAAIRDIALMTVEAERDDISDAGQTRVAHDLCPGIPDAMRAHHLEARIGHLGMFHGQRWRAGVLPALRAFLRLAEARAEAG